MAHETLKSLIMIKLPKRHTCTPQVLALLAQLNANAQAYHDHVTLVYRKLTPEQRRAVKDDPRWTNADKLVREVLAQLRENGVNLFGFSSMDFCEAFVEVYKAYAASR